MKRLLGIPLRAPRATLVVMVALTLVFAFIARRITIDSSIEELLPANDPDRAYYEDAVRVFGSEQIAMLGVFAENVFAPPTLAKIDALSERLARLDGVREVLSLTTVKTVEVGDFGLSTGRLVRELPRTAAEAETLRQKTLANPLYVKNVVSADARAAGISVIFEAMSDEEFLARGIEEQIRTIAVKLEGPEEIVITGIPTIKVQGARLMEEDTAKFIPLSMGLIVIVLAFAFRTVRGVLVPLTTVVIGVVWTTALMVLAGSAINMGTLVLNPLLMVIGIASGIHVVNQYYLELRPGRSAFEVVETAMEHIRLPVAIAAVTTLVGFATLALAPIRAVREFGLYSVAGILVILLASLTVAPAALVLLPLPKPKRADRAREEDALASGQDETGEVAGDQGVIGRVLHRLGAMAVSRPRTVLTASLLVCGVCALGIRHIEVETDYIGFFSPDSSVRVDNDRIARHLGGTQPIYVVIDGTAPQSVTRLETLSAIRDLQAFIDQQQGVDKTVSIVDYLGLVRAALAPKGSDDATEAGGAATAPAAGTLPDNQRQVDEILLLVNPDDVRAVLSRDQRRANIVVRTNLSRSVEVNDFVERVRAFAERRFPGDVSVRPTGTIVLLNRSADALAWGQVTGLWQEVVVLLALLSFLFLSVRVGVLALIPNVLPTVVLFGIMGWTGIPLNISTSTIAAIAIGIAIDDTIHFLSTFNAELRRTGDQGQAVMNALNSAGRAAVYVSVALAAGFLIVCLSNFQPVRYFGLLSAVTMGVALATELFLTPALVTTTKIITVWDLLFLKLGPDPHRQIPLFAGLRQFQAKIVVLMGHLARASRGAFITRRGEMEEELYVLLNGQAEVRLDHTLVGRIGRGDVVGEMGLVRHQPRSADVVAVEDTEYLVLDAGFLRRLRRRYPRIAATVFYNLTRILSDKLERTTDRLAHETPAQRSSWLRRVARLR